MDGGINDKTGKLCTDAGADILVSAIKMSNDLQKVLSIMSEEYKGPSSSNVFRKLAEHETENKNRLSEIYDEMINKDYW